MSIGKMKFIKLMIGGVLCLGFNLYTEAAENKLIAKAAGWALYEYASSKAAPKGNLVFEGTLHDDSVEAIIQNFEGQQSKNKTLLIKSSGGPASPAIRLGWYIHKHNVALHIKDYCASSCAYFIIPAASKVFFSKKAVIGVHHSPSEKFFKGVNRMLLKRKQANEHDSISQNKTLKALETNTREMNQLLPLIDAFYAELGLAKDGLLHVTNLHLKVMGSLRKDKQPRSVRTKVIVIPDKLFFEQCLGYNVSKWHGYNQEYLKDVSINSSLPMVFYADGKFIFKQKVISKSDYLGCATSKV